MSAKTVHWLANFLIVHAAVAISGCTLSNEYSRGEGAGFGNAVDTGTELFFFLPKVPGQLARCVDDGKDKGLGLAVGKHSGVWSVAVPHEVRWNGGGFTQLARPHANDVDGNSSEPTLDVCFILVRHGRTVASGAVISTYSARILEMPTLIRVGRRSEGGVVYELRRRFPGQPDDQVPDWLM